MIARALIAQDICYTGHSGRNSFVQFGIRYFLRTRQLHTNRLGVNAFCSGHLRPVINKAGRSDCRNQRIRARYGENAENAEGPSSPQKNKGPRRAHGVKKRKMQTAKRGKRGKYGWLALLWLALGDTHFALLTVFLRNAGNMSASSSTWQILFRRMLKGALGESHRPLTMILKLPRYNFDVYHYVSPQVCPFLVGSNVHTIHLYHDSAPCFMIILLQKY